MLPTYVQAPCSDSTLGKKFEELMLINFFCNLKENEALAREIDDNLRFDDIVLEQNINGQAEYRYYQLKHSDTEKTGMKSLTWTDLLIDDNSNFSLMKYFLSYLNRSDRSKKIIELGFVTNITLTPTAAASQRRPSNLKKITKTLNTTSRKRKPSIFQITQRDISCYFQSVQNDFGSAARNVQSFKFSNQGVDDVTKSSGLPVQDHKDMKEFLRLVVFHVGFPHANELEENVEASLMIYLPFFWGIEKAASYDMIKTEILTMFQPLRNCPTPLTSFWVRTAYRSTILGCIAAELKKIISLGSTKHYEVKVLRSYLTGLNPFKGSVRLDEIPWNKLFSDQGEEPFEVLNVHCESTNATVTSLKLLEIIYNSRQTRRSFFVQVSDGAGIRNLIEYFKDLNEKKLRFGLIAKESFACFIEVSPHFTPVNSEEPKRLATELSKLNCFVRFVLITQESLCGNISNCKVIKDENPLDWNALDERGKTFLFRKKLYFNDVGGCSSTLQALGVSKESIEQCMQSIHLAEFIVHDESRAVSLGLPQFDRNVNSCYIDRYLSLSERSEQISFPDKNLLDEEVCFWSKPEESKLAKVVDWPGHGKSWLLKQLCNHYLEEISRENSKLLRRLVLKINLLEVQQKAWINGVNLDKDSGPDVYVNFLVSHILGLHTNELSACIIKLCLINSNASLILLFDGFEEISEKNREITKNLIHGLLKENGMKRIVITSRPNYGMKEEIRTWIRPSSLNLNVLTETDQKEVLVKHWQGKLEATKFQRFETTVNKYATKLIEKISELFYSEPFLEMPLHCFLVSVCYYDELTQHLNTLESYNSLIELSLFSHPSSGLIQLCDHCFNAKVHILFEEKAHLTNKNETSELMKQKFTLNMTNAMKRLAVLHLMPDIPTVEILLRLTWEDYTRNDYAEDLKIVTNLGMLYYSMNESEPPTILEAPPQKILYQAFAEYFFAKFLADHFTTKKSKLLDNPFLSEDVQNKTFEIIIEKILYSDDYKNVLYLLDRMLAQHLPSEKLPFLVQDRLKFLDKWPVIGHQKFNDYLFEWTKKASIMTKVRRGLPGLLLSLSFAPVVGLLLILCLKEHEMRSVYSNEEREKFLLNVIRPFVLFPLGNDLLRAPGGEKIVTSVLQWFDWKEETLTSWDSELFFMLVDCLISDEPTLTKLPEIIGIACSLLKHHREHITNSSKRVQSIAEGIFGKQNAIWGFLSCTLIDIQKMEKLSLFFLEVLELNKLITDDKQLLDLQFNCFHELKMNWKLKLLEEKRIMNPFALTKFAKFLIENRSRSEFSVQVFHLYKEILGDFFSELPNPRKPLCLKWSGLMLVALSDQLVDLIEGERELNLFNTPTGRFVLITYANFKCCRQDSSAYLQSIIHFIRRNDCKSEGSIKNDQPWHIFIHLLENWLTKNLRDLWNGEGEIKFIDFLFNMENYDIEHQYGDYKHADETCLLFCDLVSDYVRNRCSPEGLKHLAHIIKCIPHPSQITLWDSIMEKNSELTAKMPTIEAITEFKKLFHKHGIQ